MSTTIQKSTENNTEAANSCSHCDLKKICFPHGLTTEELSIFEGSVEKTLKIAKKEKLYSRGDPLKSVYAIKAGSIKTYLATSKGQAQVLGFHMPGDLLGFDGFANDHHASDAVAMEDTLLCELPMANFENLCDVLPGLRKVMMQQVGSEISRHHSLVLTLGQMQTEERLATYLLRLSCYYNSRGYSCKQFNLPMARHDLANFLGMAPETLSRMFAKLEKLNVISINRREVSILDMEGLMDLSHELCMRED
ncbi:MAG: helix-turn-helix domain-containing protein [Thiotrichaceae bacterium]